MKIMNRCAKAQGAAAGVLRLYPVGCADAGHGRTAARTIRAMNRPDAKTVLMFALSADAFVEDERLSAESGMNGHFAKPVDFAALQRSIGKFLRQRRG